MGSRRRKGSENDKNGSFCGKKMCSLFYLRYQIVPLTYLDSGKTFNHRSFIKDCLQYLVFTLKEQRPKWVPKYLKFHHDYTRPHVHMSLKSN